MALVSAEQARIDVDGAPLVERLTFSADGARIALIGGWKPLFALLAGQARLRSGRVTVMGTDAERAVADAIAGVAPLDAAFFRDWTVERYLETGARLAGFSRREARAELQGVLTGLGLGELGTRRLGSLPVAEQRAVVVAQALIGGPRVLLIEDPMLTLDERGASVMLGVIERAAQGRALVLSSSIVPASGPLRELIDRTDSVLVLEAGSVVAQSLASAVLVGENRYLVSVSRNGAELAARLGELGLSVEASLDSLRFLVRLSNSSKPRTILDAALDVEAPVLELRPLSFGAPESPA